MHAVIIHIAKPTAIKNGTYKQKEKKAGQQILNFLWKKNLSIRDCLNVKRIVVSVKQIPLNYIPDKTEKL